jgi:Uma2 family endonuclease
MVQAKNRFASFEDYLALDPEELPEGFYEYVDGELVDLMTESGLNDTIGVFLFTVLLSAGIPYQLLKPGRCEIEVVGKPRTRFPDLVVLAEEHPPLLLRRNTITRDMPPPRAVMEVVSAGKQNRDRDWIDKRRQYAEIRIPEYWRIDPEQQCIMVLKLADHHYIEHGIFRGKDWIDSPIFGRLQVTAEQILNAG